MTTALEERRSVPLVDVELRAASDGDGLSFRGLAALYDSPTDIGPFREQVASGAFDKTLNDGADVRFLVNHEGVPLARTKSGTLQLSSVKRGLQVDIPHLDPLNPRAAELISAMKRKDLDQMSFAFMAMHEDPPTDENDNLRTLQEVRLFDVSAVTYPAYEDTTAELRQKKVELLSNYAHSLGITIRNDAPEVPAESVDAPEDHRSGPSLTLLKARVAIARARLNA